MSGLIDAKSDESLVAIGNYTASSNKEEIWTSYDISIYLANI